MKRKQKTIVIAGAHSHIGKTTLGQKLLQGLGNWSALKVTVSHIRDGLNLKYKCPRRTNCDVCSSLTKKYDIIIDRKIINQKGTDTARLKEAGAKKVAWLKSTLGGLEKGLKKAFLKLKDSEGIIIEGTSVVRYINPDLVIYLRDGSRDLKPSAKEAQRKADIIIDVSR